MGWIMDGTSQSICTNWTERLKPFGQRAIPPSPRWIRESIHSKSKWTIARGRQIVIYDVSGASRTGPYFAVLYLWFEKGKIRCFCCDWCCLIVACATELRRRKAALEGASRAVKFHLMSLFFSGQPTLSGLSRFLPHIATSGALRECGAASTFV